MNTAFILFMLIQSFKNIFKSEPIQTYVIDTSNRIALPRDSFRRWLACTHRHNRAINFEYYYYLV